MRGLRHGLWWAVVLVGTSCAAAQSVEVTASLEAPAGADRPGTYAAVRIRATNRTGETLTAVRVETGGPVEVTAPWRLAPNETAEKVLPVFYAGGDLVVAVTFTTMRGKDVTPEKSPPVSIRPLPSTLAADTDALVQPEAYRLFTSEGWSAKRLEHLWLWLVVFAWRRESRGRCGGRWWQRRSSWGLARRRAPRSGFSATFGEPRCARPASST